MSLSMGSLLVHSERLPVAVRDALRAAQASPAESRHDMLESAARILRDEVGVPCSDARELVDLQPGDCGG